MAGIAGLFCRRGGGVPRDVLARQSEALAHRGRAGETLWHEGSVGLAHRDDAVAPPICPDGQPLADASGRFRIVCDGRIFNAREVGKAITDRGISMGAGSILEVMLQAFAIWGADAFARFNGAFACAIWDQAERRLWLARDQLGVRPLYYALVGDSLLFGSEVKAILAHPDCPKAPDDTGIANYLTFNTVLLQAEATFYRSVRRLLPGHVLAADDAGVRSTTYWTLDPSREDSRPVDDHCVAAVRELITDAIRIRLPEGDRLGAALTGGYDSSSIVCLMGHLDRTERGGRATIDTFSFDFGTDEADEVELIDLVARKVGARHHHVESLTPGLLDDLDTLIRANDGPVLESVMLLLWKKKRVAAAAGIDVLLSGLAGDELFMGTLDFLADLLRRGRWVELCRQVQSMYPVDRSTGKATSLRGLSRAYMVAPLLPERLRRLLKTYVGRPFPPEWIAPVLAARAGLTGRLPRSRGPRFATAFHQRAWELLGGDVMGGVLPYHDVCSAAAGVDTRFPYLDVRLVEMLFAVPREWKIDRGQVRRLQKRAMATVLPAEVQHDHLKKNFHPPLNRFMRQACRAEMDALLARPGALAREYLEWTELRGYYERYLDGRVDDPSPVWGALNLERWLEANWG